MGNEKVINKLKEYKRKGGKYVDICKYLDISKYEMSKILHNKRSLNIKRLKKLSNFFNCSLDDLV